MLSSKNTGEYEYVIVEEILPSEQSQMKKISYI